MHTLLVLTLLIFVPAIVERYCDSELRLGNICESVSRLVIMSREDALPVISSGKIDSKTSLSSF